MHNSPERVVLVANTKKIPNKGYAKHMSRLDISKWFTNKFLANAIRKNGYDLIEYDNLNDFNSNISRHKHDLVFPYYFGVASKMRESFVPAICESQGIRFVGADAYTQTIANDKALSKEICRYAGISTPIFKILFDNDFPPDISSLNPPLIVKPQFEGDSIGISKSNVFASHEGVIDFAKSLRNDLQQSILIEEFIAGCELSVCLIGYKRSVKKIASLTDITKHEIVNSYNRKKYRVHIDRFRDVDDLFDQQMLDKMTSLFQSLDKLEYVRLDFIHCDGVFYNIELTPGPDLSPYSYMYGAFKKEMSYTEFIGLLISNCLERYVVIESRVN